MQTSNSPLLFWVGIITMTKTMTKKKTKTMTMTLTFFRCIHKCSLSTVICQVTFTVSICQRRLEVKAWIMYPLAAICSQQIHKVLKWRQGGGGGWGDWQYLGQGSLTSKLKHRLWINGQTDRVFGSRTMSAPKVKQSTYERNQKRFAILKAEWAYFTAV